MRVAFFYLKIFTKSFVFVSQSICIRKLVLKLGYSHPIELEDPEGITTETPDANTIVIKGIDKAQVGNYAANVRGWRPPEPYKGKGVLYEGEVVHKKEGKSGATA